MMQRKRIRNSSRHRVHIFATRLAKSAEPANIPPRRPEPAGAGRRLRNKRLN
jgi:hypothetical protein